MSLRESYSANSRFSHQKGSDGGSSKTDSASGGKPGTGLPVSG